MPTSTFAFSVAFIALIGAPFLAPSMAWLLRRTTAPVQRASLTLMSALFGCVAVSWLCDLQTQSYELNAVLMAVSLVCAGTLGLSAFRLKQRPLNRLLGFFSCALLVLSLFAGTAGALLVMFLVDDTIPVYVADMPGHQTCYVHSYGNALSSPHGYDIAIRRQSSVLPFVELPAAHYRFDLSSPSSPAPFCSESALRMAEGR